MDNPPIILTGRSITDHGIVFVPGDGAPGFDGMTIPEVIMWNDTDEVTVVVAADAVYVTTETAESCNSYVSSVVRRTTCYRCPVKVMSCRPNFTVFDNIHDDTYVPSDDVPNFGMFSDEGNIAVQVAVNAAINADDMTTAVEVAATVTDHPEVNDTVVRDYITNALFDAGLLRD